jgi:hypothetical protein
MDLRKKRGGRRKGLKTPCPLGASLYSQRRCAMSSSGPSDQPSAATKDPEELARRPFNPRSTPLGGCMMIAVQQRQSQETTSNESSPRSTFPCACHPLHARLLARLGGSASPGPTSYQRRLESMCTNCRDSSSTRSTPRGPNVPSPRQDRTAWGCARSTRHDGPRHHQPSSEGISGRDAHKSHPLHWQGGPTMASRAALASQMEQPDPPINEHSGGASPKNQPTP